MHNLVWTKTPPSVPGEYHRRYRVGFCDHGHVGYADRHRVNVVMVDGEMFAVETSGLMPGGHRHREARLVPMGQYDTSHYEWSGPIPTPEPQREGGG